MERGLSQEALADAAMLERSYVGKLENSRFAVSIDTIERLAEALRVEPPELLIRGNAEPKPGHNA